MTLPKGLHIVDDKFLSGQMMKIFRIIALLILILPSLSRAADLSKEASLCNAESYFESSGGDTMDDRALNELTSLCSEWMSRNDNRDFQAATLFMATFVKTPGKDYPYIYTYKALDQGTNPNIRDKEGKTPLMIAK